LLLPAITLSHKPILQKKGKREAGYFTFSFMGLLVALIKQHSLACPDIQEYIVVCIYNLESGAILRTHSILPVKLYFS